MINLVVQDFGCRRVDYGCNASLWYDEACFCEAWCVRRLAACPSVVAIYGVVLHGAGIGHIGDDLVDPPVGDAYQDFRGDGSPSCCAHTSLIT